MIFLSYAVDCCMLQLQVLRNEIVQYMNDNPSARLYITGHSLGG